MEIISAKYLLTMESDPLFDGAIAIENKEIIDVGLEKDLLQRYPHALHEDYPRHVLMPGLINVHTHLDMTHHKDFPGDPVRTLVGPVNYVDWLLACIDYKRQKNSEQFREALEEGLELCVEAGTTCVADMGSYEGIFRSLAQVGIRGVVFPEVLSYDSRVAKDLYETALGLVEKYAEIDSDLLNVGVGPYSPYTLSRNILKIMAQYCKSAHLPLMIHVSESFSEMEFFYNSSGEIATRLFPNIGWGDDLPLAHQKTPIGYLHEIGFLSAKPILVGCVQATQKDLELIATSGAKVVWCPRSQEYLKLGRAPVVQMVKKGIPVVLGTDGLSSTNSLSLWDELRAAYELTSKDLLAKDLFAMVTKNAALVLGLEGEIGTLARGKKADYLLVDISSLPDETDFYKALLCYVRDYHVHKVVANGETLKRVN